MKRILTIDIGGTFVKSALMDENGEFLQRFSKRPTAKDSQFAFADMLRALIAEVCQQHPLDGIAISAPGMIDSTRGIMHNGGSIFVIQELALVDILSSEFNLPVTIENDARCAALAEYWKGSLQGCHLGIALIIGTAVGSGIVMDGNVLHGAHLFAGEVGYLMTNASEPAKRNNLLAEQGGVPALIALAADKTGIDASQLTGEIIFQQTAAGNERFLSALRDYASRLAVQICNLQVILDPDRIAIGGGISEQPLLIKLLQEAVECHRKVYPHKLPQPQIAACRFCNDANLIGALYHHLTT